MRLAKAALLGLFVVFLLGLGLNDSAHAASSPVWSHPASSRLSMNPTPIPGGPAAPNYDEQIGLTFTQDFTSIAYNVTATAQSDVDGYGPAYLLNGLSDAGYWYQVGIAYNWPYLNGGYNSGFHLLYEVFDSSGNSIYPVVCCAGSLSFSGPVSNGDSVLLNLYFSNSGEVTMYAYDWNSGAHASESYTSEGVRFVGLSATSDSNGFFTGLMTEWYHTAAYSGGEGQVTYKDSGFALTSGYVWADEYAVPCCASVIFSDYSHLSFQNPLQIQSFSSNGATAYADAYTFITGATDKNLLTLSYSVAGGGVGYSPPNLTYSSGSLSKTATLTAIPTTFFVDPSSSWTVASELPGGSSIERWATNQQTSGVSSSSQTIELTYYYQLRLGFSFSVVGGGSGYSSPDVTYVQFGGQATATANSSVWADASSSFLYPQSLGGSTATERWEAATPSGLVGGSGTVLVRYYHQYGLYLSYATTGLPQGPPGLEGTQFGVPFSASVSVRGTNSVYYLDSGTGWSMPALLPGSTTHERWATSHSTNGTVSQSLSLLLLYQHQFAVAISSASPQGGSVISQGGWTDAGGTISLSQSAASGWGFEGWSGSGPGSYSGGSNSTSVQVNAPINETATFYPSLQISAGADGTVSYSFGNQKGTVPVGSTVTVYAPPGTSIALDSAPTSFLYEFAGWSQGAQSASSHTEVALDSPKTVAASFALNATVIGSIVIGALVVVGVAALALKRRGRAAS